MNHLVINGFICKESGNHHQPGSFFESDNFGRVKDLESKGLIIANENATSLEVKETKTKQPAKKVSEKVVRKNKESIKDKS